MISENFFKKAVCISVLAALSLQSFAYETDKGMEYDSVSTFYAKGFYNMSYVGSVNIEKSGTSYTAATGTDAAERGSVIQGSVSGDYDPDYKINFLGGGAGLGYSYSNMRVELEGLFTGDIKIDVDDDNNQQNINKSLYATTGVPYNLQTEENGLDGITTVAVGPANHTKFKYVAGLLNAYYDISMGGSINPYVGGGIGIAQTEFHGGDMKVKAYPMALQGKIGASLNMSAFTGTSVTPYIGYRVLYLAKKEADDSISGLNVHRKVDTTKKESENEGGAANGGDLTEGSETPAGSEGEAGATDETSGSAADGDADTKAVTDEASPIDGLDYKMEASYLLHNLEVGIMIPLNY